MVDGPISSEAQGVPEHPVVERLRREVSLGDAARQGAAWIGAARIASQVAQLLAVLVTARILLPSQFGEAAIALAVAAFAQLFTDLGLAAAVVHARFATPEILATAFWLNMASGLALTGLVLALAYPLSSLFHHPVLAGLLGIVSLNFTCSCAIVQTALLERTFNYRRLATYETCAATVGTFTTPALAVVGVGTPSLVLGPLVTIVVLSAILWIRVPWRPTHRPTRAAAIDLWRYCRGLVGFNALNYWSRNIDTLLLGARVTTRNLGDYTRAFNLTMIPIQQMNLVLGRVLFPSLSRMRDDRARMGRAWLRAVLVTGSLTLPVTVTLAAAAPALTYVLLGPRWQGMVPELELLALATTPQIIASASGGLFRAAGATDTMLRLGLLGTFLSVTAILLGLPWGTEGVAAAILLMSALSVPVVFVPLCRVVGIAFADGARMLSPMVAPAAALGIGELAVRLTAPAQLSPWATLPLQLAAGVALYIPLLYRVNPSAVEAVRTGVRGALLRVRRSSVLGSPARSERDQ